jgi:hypothetical protein
MTHADKVKEFYREQGRTEEQERIIKLLTDNDYVGAVTLIRLAERIKGDNK